jgi:replicative DNA helicase
MKNIEHKLLATVIHNPELFEDLSQYEVFRNQESKDLFNILTAIQNKHSMIKNELIVNFIQESKNYRIGTYYDILGEYEEKSYYKGYLNELLIRNTKEELLSKAHEISNQNYKDLINIKQDIEQVAGNIKLTEGGKEKTRQEILQKIACDMKEGKLVPKVESGIHFIDSHQRGYNLFAYIIIAAAQSVGKSAFMLDRTVKQLRLGKRIFIQSCEMTKEVMYALFACHVAGIDSNKYDNGQMNNQEQVKFVNALETLYNYPLYIYDKGREWSDIKRNIKYFKKEKNIDMAYIDYLQYIRIKGVNRQFERLEIISGDTKDLAKELLIPIAHIAALNRSGKTADRPPISEDIKGNGDLEYDADIVILLDEKIDRGDYREVNFYIRKNKFGKKGAFTCRFSPAVRQFKYITKMEGYHGKDENFNN